MSDTLTPDELAKKHLEEWRISNRAIGAEQMVAEAIRAAVAAERERCVKLRHALRYEHPSTLWRQAIDLYAENIRRGPGKDATDA